MNERCNKMHSWKQKQIAQCSYRKYCASSVVMIPFFAPTYDLFQTSHSSLKYLLFFAVRKKIILFLSSGRDDTFHLLFLSSYRTVERIEIENVVHIVWMGISAKTCVFATKVMTLKELFFVRKWWIEQNKQICIFNIRKSSPRQINICLFVLLCQWHFLALNLSNSVSFAHQNWNFFDLVIASKRSL